MAQTAKVLMLLPQANGFYSLPPVASGVYSSGEAIGPNYGADVYIAAQVDAALAQRDRRIELLERRLARFEALQQKE